MSTESVSVNSHSKLQYMMNDFRCGVANNSVFFEEVSARKHENHLLGRILDFASSSSK